MVQGLAHCSEKFAAEWIAGMLQAFHRNHGEITEEASGSQQNDLRQMRRLLLSIGETGLPFVQGPMLHVPDNLSQGMATMHRSRVLLHTIKIDMGLSVQCDFKTPTQRCSHAGIDPADPTIHTAFMQTLRQHISGRRTVLILGDIFVSKVRDIRF